jgi:hypothetical protein
MWSYLDSNYNFFDEKSTVGAVGATAALTNAFVPATLIVA